MSTYRKRLIIFFDGGCRPNPGPMTTAVVMKGRTYWQTALGIGDNNEAEWLALCHAAQLAVDVETPDVLLVGDSATIVQQALGRSPCRADRLRVHRDRFLLLSASLPRFHIQQRRRSQNLAGIALDRLGWR